MQITYGIKYQSYFKEKMSVPVAGLEIARAYLDDLLIFSTETGFDWHLEKLEQVLTRLQEASLKINGVKLSLHKQISSIWDTVFTEQNFVHHKRK